MKKILFLGSNKGVIQMIQYAQSIGVYTIVTDNLSPEVSIAKQFSDEYWMISTKEIDTLVQQCRRYGVNGILCGISGFNIDRAMELSTALNLPFYCTKESREVSLVKHKFKNLCRLAGVPVAKDYFVNEYSSEYELNNIQLPVVVKAVDQSANRGMTFCYQHEEIKPAIKYARSFSSNENVIVERMLHGVEYTAFYALADGEASLVNLFSDLAQPGTPHSCYAVNSTACDKLDVFLKEVDPYFKDALKMGGMKDGVCWIELILDEDGHFYVIEMGYRLSGDMMALPIRDICGFDAYKWLVDFSLGKRYKKSDLPNPQSLPYQKCGCSYILWSNNTAGVVKKITGIHEILQIVDIVITQDVKQGDTYRQYQYMLTFSFSRDGVEEVIDTITYINNTISVLNEDDKDVLIRFTDFDELRRIYYCK